MLEFVLFVASLFFCAGVGMWLCLLAVRATKVALGQRRRRYRNAILAAITRFRMKPEPERLVEELRQADPAALIEIASRLLPLFSAKEREVFETALARSRLALFMRGRIGGANEAKRLLYCELLGVLGSERASGTLKKAMDDPSPAVRIAAAISLAARGEIVNVRALLARLGTDARRSARLTYLFEELLVERLEDVRSIAGDLKLEPRVRISASVALSRLGEAEYRDRVGRMVADPSPPVAAAAARLLLEGPHPDAAPLIAKLLASNSTMVRREASECAARLQDVGLAPALRRVLRDRDPVIHAAAARSLVHLAQGTRPGASRAVPAPRARELRRATG